MITRYDIDEDVCVVGKVKKIIVSERSETIYRIHLEPYGGDEMIDVLENDLRKLNEVKA